MKKIYTRILTVLFVALVAAAPAISQNIMYVISGDDLETTPYQSEKDLADSMLTWGYLVDPWNSGDINAGGLEAFYPDYDGIVISEWVGSSSVNNIAVDNYQLPIITFEGFGPRDGRWNWISDNDNMFNQASGEAVDPHILIIEDASHYITQGYSQGDEVPWCDPSQITETIGVTSWAEDKVEYSYKLAKNKAQAAEFPEFWHIVAVEDDVLPNRVVMWGCIGTGLDNGVLDISAGTPEFFGLFHRACEWAILGMDVGVEQEAATVFEMAAFPNPAADRVIFRFESPVFAPAVATLYNVTGQQVETFRRDAVSGRNFIEMDVAGYAPGVYHVGLELDGKREFLKLVVQ